MKLNRSQMVWRAAQDIGDGWLVNLGIGLPVAVADHIPQGLDVFFHSENGVVGVGPLATGNQRRHRSGRCRQPDHHVAHGRFDRRFRLVVRMIRGGHIDVTVLGAFEVAENGDLANWDMKSPAQGAAGRWRDGSGSGGEIGVDRHGAQHALRRAAQSSSSARCR